VALIPPFIKNFFLKFFPRARVENRRGELDLFWSANKKCRREVSKDVDDDKGVQVL